ncbi:alpha/beta fold hydrolase [Pseudonocardia endophytica]|uniref:Pimeloyl-ACP methyl ester carboxylesterase n=1 Tax=Pseudonocardia endophytica TaxID=401976 RepID=A0A4R1HZ82_PSEEN|nr:alpha/beta hydrolase [Pseudonocardia endophytica]TCK26200.1 pimeloyl-ACP methyl ester carboxylesterase [Pseudonocardia endophytica]
MIQDAVVPPVRRRRRVLLAALAAVVVVLVAVLAGRDSSPVGHVTSAEGADRYRAAYDRAMADLPPPAAVLDVRTAFGVVRAYRFAGADPSATPLLLLPGTASGAPVFADNMPSLLALRDVWLVDLLGEPGMSVQDRPITTDADKAAWLDETLRGLPPQRFHLLGLSIGGWTAVNLVIHAPDAPVASLTLLDPVQVYGDIPLWTALRSVPAAVSWFPRSWRDGFNSYTAGGAPVQDVPVADMIEAGMSTYAMRLPQPSLVPEDRLRAIRVPVLAIVAGRSVMHDPATSITTAERVFGPENVRVYPDASHAINGEQPDRVAADVAAFLARIGS